MDQCGLTDAPYWGVSAPFLGLFEDEGAAMGENRRIAPCQIALVTARRRKSELKRGGNSESNTRYVPLTKVYHTEYSYVLLYR